MSAQLPQRAPEPDLNSAYSFSMAEHLELARATFNQTWEYLDRDDRTEADNRVMLTHAAASWYHWRQVGDSQNRSLSDWQMSRVLAVLGSADLARSFGAACLEISTEADLAPFYVAMAHESIARAAMVGGDDAARHEHVAAAKELLGSISESEEIEILTNDLASLE